MSDEYVDFMIDRINPDPVQYKPYSPSFIPASPLAVRIPLESGSIIQDGNVTILNLDGFQALLATLADAIDDMDKSRRLHINRVKSPLAK
jgi:hypothetical protein